MADRIITAANVVAAASAQMGEATSGEAIDAGEIIFFDGADSDKAKLADANDSAKIVARGMALNSAPGADQPVSYIISGEVTVGATSPAMAAGDIFILSATPGKMAPASDAATGWYVVAFAVAKSATVLEVSFEPLIYSTAAKA